MTKKQLIEALAPFPDTMDVYVGERKTDFYYGIVNSVYTKKIPFTEEPVGKIIAKETVIVIDED